MTDSAFQRLSTSARAECDSLLSLPHAGPLVTFPLYGTSATAILIKSQLLSGLVTGYCVMDGEFLPEMHICNLSVFWSLVRDYIADKNRTELLNWVESTHKFLKGHVCLDPEFCFRAISNHRQLTHCKMSSCVLEFKMNSNEREIRPVKEGLEM